MVRPPALKAFHGLRTARATGLSMSGNCTPWGHASFAGRAPATPLVHTTSGATDDEVREMIEARIPARHSFSGTAYAARPPTRPRSDEIPPAQSDRTGFREPPTSQPAHGPAVGCSRVGPSSDSRGR